MKSEKKWKLIPKPSEGFLLDGLLVNSDIAIKSMPDQIPGLQIDVPSALECSEIETEQKAVEPINISQDMRQAADGAFGNENAVVPERPEL